MRRLILVVLGMFASLQMGAPARADLIVNGSFEQSDLGNVGSFVTLGGGSTAITGWTVTGSAVDYIGTYWMASDGQFSLDLSALAAGGVQQTFATVAGQSYTVLFDMAGNPVGPPAIKSMEVSAAGNSQLYTFNVSNASQSNMLWVTQSFTFVATATETTLAFTSLDNTSFGPALDNVRVTAAAVPEPASLTMAATGVLLIAAGKVSRRRRSAA